MPELNITLRPKFDEKQIVFTRTKDAPYEAVVITGINLCGSAKAPAFTYNILYAAGSGGVAAEADLKTLAEVICELRASVLELHEKRPNHTGAGAAGPQVDTVLVLSTSHVTKPEAEDMNAFNMATKEGLHGDAKLKRMVELSQEHHTFADSIEDMRSLETIMCPSPFPEAGWMLCCVGFSISEKDDENKLDPNLFPGLHAVTTYAKRLGFEYVRFDCDADTVDELKAYDW